jgi:hypothetical protein
MSKGFLRAKISKQLTTFAGILLGASFWMPLSATANSNVFATYNIVDSEVRVFGGGPLFDDGKVGGNVSVSFENGKIFFLLQPTEWSQVDSETVNICYNVRVIKNEPNIPLPPFFCDTAPITGTPVKIDIDGNGRFELLIRVTRTLQNRT